LIRTIRLAAQDSATFTGRATIQERVLDAIRQVRRNAFVPASEADHAWTDRAMPIGHGQTISQPFIVALMTDVIEPEPHHRVLEIGTGSGYQAAVLSALVQQVYSVEVIPALAERARAALAAEGCRNVQIRVGDGRLGWPEEAPFDAVVVTAASRDIPPALPEQLRPGGRMIIPLGQSGNTQILTLIEKSDEGAISTREILPVAFVPLTYAAPAPDTRQ
jgi:protein-L-isoaspartate(D-aspartate) O-methyltransferase